MRLIRQSATIVTERHQGKKIELIGRICYNSRDKITEDSHEKFIESLRRKGHTSVLEHVWRTWPVGYLNQDMGSMINKEGESGSRERRTQISRGLRHLYKDGKLSKIAINQRAYELLTADTDLPNEDDLYEDIITAEFTTNRAIANELVKHRIASFTQESTRFVKYNGDMEFIEPMWFKDTKSVMAKCIFGLVYKEVEHWYKVMIDKGMAPQDARGILPQDLRTTLIMTATKDQWLNLEELVEDYEDERKSILAQRLHGSAHPQMRELMQLLVLSMRDNNDLSEQEFFKIQEFIKRQEK